MIDRLGRIAYLSDILRDELEREVIDHPELLVLTSLRDEAAELSQHLWTAHAEADTADR